MTTGVAAVIWIIFAGLANTKPAYSSQNWASLNQAGLEALQAGDLVLAEKQFRSAVAAAEPAPARSGNLAVSLTNLGQVLVERRSFKEADTIYQRACALWRHIEGERQNFALALAGRSAAVEGLGRTREAESMLRRSVRITESIFGPDHDAVAALLNNLASLYISQRRYADAQPPLDRAQAISRKSGDRLGLATALNNLGTACYGRKDLTQAEKYLAEALDIRRLELGGGHPDVALVLNNMGNVQQRRKKFLDAERWYREALEIDEKSFGTESRVVRADLDNLADLYREMGDPERANQYRERAKGTGSPGSAARAERRRF